jgi:hypothetical protein
MTKSHRQIKHARKKQKQKQKRNKLKSLANKAEATIEKREKRETHLLQKQIRRLQNKDFTFRNPKED